MQSRDSSSPNTNLGLAERRALAAYKSEKWPAVLETIRQAAGFEVPVEVRWDELALPGQADRYQTREYLGLPIFEPLVAALTDITRDDMGKEALRAKLARIVVRYDPPTGSIANYPNGLTFEGGVLDINWMPGVNPEDEAQRKAALVDLLERNL
jgi:hypothetical protein